MLRITVLGIGNPIMADDGIGLELLHRLKATGPAEGKYDQVELLYVDGGTSGMEVLPDVEDADWLIVLDALAGPGAPGTIHTLIGDQIPRLLQSKLSPHQVGLLDLLSVARLGGNEPTRVAVVGIVAETVTLNVGLSATAESALTSAAETARDLVQEWLDEATTSPASAHDSTKAG